MSKVFISVLDCKTESKIFTGKNALKHALYYCQYGYVANDADYLYKFKPVIDKAISWHHGDNGFTVNGLEISGDGVHAKCYELPNHLIYSSQNNVDSSLFEFAIVYEKRPKHSEYFKKILKKAKEYTEWWVNNRRYGLKVER